MGFRRRLDPGHRFQRGPVTGDVGSHFGRLGSHPGRNVNCRCAPDATFHAMYGRNSTCSQQTLDARDSGCHCATMRRQIALLGACLSMACSETEPAPAQDGGAVVDSGVSLDGSPSDTGRPDATAMDGGDSNDGGSSDSGVLDFDQQIAARLAAQTVPVTALAPPPAVADELYALGRALFFDPILSGNMDVACASCHHPSAATSDALSLSIGSGGTGVGAARGGPGHPPFIARHAPELFNRGDPSWSRMFWDGRVQADPTGTVTGPAALPMGVTTVLAAQALFPLLDRAEMRGQRGDQTVRNTPNELAQIADDQVDAIWAAIVSRLLAIPAYTALFSSAYPGVTTADRRSPTWSTRSQRSKRGRLPIPTPRGTATCAGTRPQSVLPPS